MGVRGPDPFDNDAAADFLALVERSPARAVSKALCGLARAPVGKYLDAELGNAAWAASVLVALAFGYGETAGLDDDVLAAASRLKAFEEQRLLALEVLARLGQSATSELAALWHEAGNGQAFDESLADLRGRLEAASAGARELSKPKAGDVIGLPVAAGSTELVVVQAVGPGEIAIFEGKCADEKAALEAVQGRAAQRVPTSINELCRHGRVLGNAPVRKELKAKKLYAGWSGMGYLLSTASAGGARLVPYAEARDIDALRRYGVEEIRGIALGTAAVERVRSEEERERGRRG